MVKFNREQLRDKIHACWIGKNIGGTIGQPYEGVQEMLELTGFTSRPGEPLPNDDLDLQLVWLCALEEIGPFTLTSKELADYWLAYIPPYWNEYGIAKANLYSGIQPPLCGECHNEKWRHSNGAWIRSEIWACLAPGYPKIARRYAFEDACIDHGMGEGTVAEIFTVTLESLAFFKTNIREIIDEALESIPADSRVAKAVRLVIESYERGDDWKDVRSALVEQSKDIGWFQSPANLGYVVLGLLYGEGDFKKSVLYAVNCGDDTDCTAATVGAFLGILYGKKGLPKDWCDFVGDRIMPGSINYGYERARTLSTCEILTDRVLDMLPIVMFANGMPTEYTEGDTVLEEDCRKMDRFRLNRLYEPTPLELPQYWFYAWNSPLVRVRVEYDKEPSISVGESIEVKMIFTNLTNEAFCADVRLRLPDGLSAEQSQARLAAAYKRPDCHGDCTFKLTATEELCAKNRVMVEADIVGHAEPVLFTLQIFGK